jgi:hypothetical protein
MATHEEQTNITTGRKRLTVWAICVAAASVFAILPVTALASTVHSFTLNFEPLVGSITFSQPEAVAADAAGDVYVFDVFNKQVTKWDINGAPVNFSALGTNVLSGRNYGEFGEGNSFSQVAVAPPGSAGGTAGDIYFVGGYNNTSVHIFAPDGTEIGQLTQANGSALHAPFGVAVDAQGRVYISDYISDFHACEIDRYVPSANPVTGADWDAQITGLGPDVGNLAVDSSGAVYASTAPNGPLVKYPASQFGGVGAGTEIAAESASIGVDPTNDDVYVAQPAGNDIAQFDSSGNLLVKFGSEHLGGPRGVAVDPTGDVFVGDTNKPNEGFVSVFAAVIPAESPAVAEEHATGVNMTDAVLRARLDPNREATKYHFEYTEHADFQENGFANAVSVPAPEASAGSGNATLSVLQPVTGLQPGTAYDFRLVATNGTGTTDGTGSTFTTYPALPTFGACPNDVLRAGLSAGLPDCRAYEQVSPTDKGGFDIDPAPVLARPDGAAVVYGSLGAFAGAPAGDFADAYVATRGSGSWQTGAVSPPDDPILTAITAKVLGASGDLSKQLVATNAKLTPQAVGGDSRAVNIYVHDSIDGSYQFVGTSRLPADQLAEFVNEANFVGASYDGSHFFFSIRKTGGLGAAGEPEDEGSKLYDFDTTSGQLSYVGVLPDGTATGSEGSGSMRLMSGLHFSYSLPALNVASRDGLRVYWSGGPAVGGGVVFGQAVYLRENGQSTLVSERHSDGAAVAAEFWGASADGSVAYITSGGRLTEDASPAGVDLYRYEAGTGRLTDLTSDGVDAKGADVQVVLGSSEDGSYVYFIANGALAPGASVGDCPGAGGSGCGIYVWHEGVTRLVATLATNADHLSVAHVQGQNPVDDVWRVSPNGRYLGFIFDGQMSGPNPEPAQPFSQAYLYSYEVGTLACASCLPDGAEATGDVSLHADAAHSGFRTKSFQSDENGLTRNVTNTGQFFFDTSDRLVAGDSNGRQDVYEYEDGRAYLISSGLSGADSYFGDATTNGTDVFFWTRAGLLSSDQDALGDLYDAHVQGGFPSALGTAGACEGEACQGAVAPPDDATPTSALFSGPGNLVPALATIVAPKKKTVAQTRAELLVGAVKACRKKSRSKRALCERRARKRYAKSGKSANVKKASSKGGKR